MAGQLIPVVVLPRFTSYLGAGTYAIDPINIEAFSKAALVFWRGPLVGGAASDPFIAYFEESLDGIEWTEILAEETTDACGTYLVEPFTKKWFRVRVVLGADTAGVVAVSLWMSGFMEVRSP